MKAGVKDFPLGSAVGGTVGKGKEKGYRMGVVREHGDDVLVVEDGAERFELPVKDAIAH